MHDPTLEEIEKEILRAVRFINVLLQEIRSENNNLQENLGMSYAKYIGIFSPFEETIKSMRKVKREFDSYLETARRELMVKYKKKYKKK